MCLFDYVFVCVCVGLFACLVACLCGVWLYVCVCLFVWLYVCLRLCRFDRTCVCGCVLLCVTVWVVCGC